ncbi:unnamed protein product [Linum tenue]|uniref:Uncharacterized protein n=4 Tax=Linum tenue TaxID=586396 RepID=A0AAV0MH20_9ROSI|nr:unnamed protein product [Linum tenue]
MPSNCFIHLVVALSTVHVIHGYVHGVRYTVTNNASGSAGGSIFDSRVGAPYTKQAMSRATRFIWKTFRQQNDDTQRKHVTNIDFFLDFMEDGIAYSSDNDIHLSASYLGTATSAPPRVLVASEIYHEMTHVWQWNGGGKAPSGLIEGIADFVRKKAGYESPSGPIRLGEGDKWDQGYGVTAGFLGYCDGLKRGFVGKLNKKMRVGYSETYFQDLLGKDVDGLWSDYKAKYQS